MNSTRRICISILASVLLAATLVAGSFATTPAAADAQICSPILGCVLEPVGETFCVRPYEAIQDQCAVYNPGGTVDGDVDWRCPRGPFLVDVHAEVTESPDGPFVWACWYEPGATPILPLQYSIPTYTTAFWAIG